MISYKSMISGLNSCDQRPGSVSADTHDPEADNPPKTLFIEEMVQCKVSRGLLFFPF